MRIFILVFLFSTQSLADSQNVKDCLRHWGNSPFKERNLTYKTMKASVSVLGTGGDLVDREETKKPKLIYVKSSVNVLGKNTIKLLNPNGWYCLNSSTNVLGKAVIELHCTAKLALSKSGATVLGSGEEQGTTVLGKTKIRRVGCKK